MTAPPLSPPSGRAWWRRIVAVLGCLPVALTGVRLLGWWPCDVACQGGGHYQHLGGIDVLWAALGLYALLACTLLRDARQALGWSALTCATAGVAAGASLFYLWVAFALQIICPFCLTVHGVVLVVLLAVAGWHAGVALLALVISALASNAAFHHRIVPDQVVEVEVVKTQADSAVEPAPAPMVSTDAEIAQADAARHRGDAQAPVQVDYVISLTCPHCATSHVALWHELTAAAAAGQAQVTVRIAVRPSDTSTEALAEWAFAAGSRSVQDFDRFVLTHLSSRSGLSRDELLRLGGELPELEALAVAPDGSRRFAGLVRADQQALRSLGYRGATPLIVIRHAGKPPQRLSYDIDPAALRTALTTVDPAP